MKAIAQDRYGSADVLRFEEVGRLEVGDHEVLIRVRAAGVNALDWHVMRGSPFVVRPMLGGWRAPRPTVRGVDVAGDVESVGKDVTRLRARGCRLRLVHRRVRGVGLRPGRPSRAEAGRL